MSEAPRPDRPDRPRRAGGPPDRADGGPVDRPATRGPARPGPYLLVAVLIAVGVALPLAVPTYARREPSLVGLPFFYWYQMLWVLIDSALLWVCYAVVRREDRRRRAAVAAPGGPAAGGAAS